MARWFLGFLLAAPLLGGCSNALASHESNYPKYAAEAAAQGRPGGPWASGTCRLDAGLGAGTDCLTVCVHGNVDACGDLGISTELAGGIGGDLSAAAQYNAACLRGSAGGCYNHHRVLYGLSEAEAGQQLARRLQAEMGALQQLAGSPAVQGKGSVNASGQIPRARVVRSTAKPVTFDSRSCRVLTANIAKTGVRIGTVTLLQGDVTFDCKLADGTSLAGSATFSACHRSEAVSALACRRKSTSSVVKGWRSP